MRVAYKDSASYYDLFASENDVAYYKELGSRYRNALEIGVGTARVALELARVGVQVWGIDNSHNMLEEARRKLEKERQEVRRRIKLFEADMRGFNLDRRFPFVYIPSSTIQHCATHEDLISCLNAINQHLKKDGVLAFNFILPSTAYNSNLRFIGKATREDTTIMRFISYRPNLGEQLLDVLLFFEVYKNGEMIRRFCDVSTIAMINKEEMLLLLQKTGFKVENVFGDYDKSKKIVDQAVIEARKI